MKDAGLPKVQINMAFDYFDEKAPQHFTNPNVRNLADMQTTLYRLREGSKEEPETLQMAPGSRGLPSDMEEKKDKFDGYDTSQQSGTTTRATESLRKVPVNKGRGKVQRPRAAI
eukprot:4748375-Amphidinium_carterae.1